MKKNTKTTTNEEIQTEEAVLSTNSQLTEDVKHSLLIVSLLANAFILIAWVALQVTTQYDYQVSMFLFYR